MERVAIFRMYECTSLPFHRFYEGSSFHGLLFDAVVGLVHLDWNLLLLEGICTKRSKFLHLRVDPAWRVRKILVAELLPCRVYLCTLTKV